MREFRVTKTFAYAADGIALREVKAGDVIMVDDRFSAGLKSAGFIGEDKMVSGLETGETVAGATTTTPSGEVSQVATVQAVTPDAQAKRGARRAASQDQN